MNEEIGVAELVDARLDEEECPTEAEIWDDDEVCPECFGVVINGVCQSAGCKAILL
jgi:hypothetical protein